jgi:hypothetical protein
MLKCLYNFSNLMSLNCLFFLPLKRVIRASSDDSDQKHGQSRVGLHIVDGPVLIVVGEVADGEAVREDHYQLDQGVQAEQANEHVETLLTLAWIVVE